MAEHDAHRARRTQLRRALVATAAVSTASIAIMYPVGFKGATNVLSTHAKAARVTVQPGALSITVASAPHLSPTSSPPAMAFGAGKTSTVVALSMHVRVLPGKAQWLADTELDSTTNAHSTTRILAGTVLYAIGDNQAWKLIAHVTGADGRVVQPRCGPLDPTLATTGNNVSTGAQITVGDAPVVVCQGRQGHSGGIFAIALDLNGYVSGAITVTVEFVV